MIFDMFSGLIERFKPDHIPLLNQARLFSFPGTAHDILPKDLSDEEVTFLNDMFFLPFSVIAVEDTASCILLQETSKDQTGVSGPWRFMECLPINTRADAFQSGLPEEATQARIDEIAREFPDSSVVTCGVLDKVAMKNNSLETGFRAYGTVDWYMIASKHKLYVPPRAPTSPEELPPTLRNARVALSEVFWFNNPTRFVVESTPAKMKPHTGPQRGVRRSHNRPVYTLLTPKEIRERLLPEEEGAGSGIKKTPHERRRHFRTLHSERFVNMQGKTITIPACWIGPSEAVKGNRRYKVMLDL
jgi:hypothetical protein